LVVEKKIETERKRERALTKKKTLLFLYNHHQNCISKLMLQNFNETLKLVF